jgi:hypothetical protein
LAPPTIGCAFWVIFGTFKVRKFPSRGNKKTSTPVKMSTKRRKISHEPGAPKDSSPAASTKTTATKKSQLAPPPPPKAHSPPSSSEAESATIDNMSRQDQREVALATFKDLVPYQSSLTNSKRSANLIRVSLTLSAMLVTSSDTRNLLLFKRNQSRLLLRDAT